MKIEITFLPNQTNDYVNHSILINQGSVQLQNVDVGECEEILALNILEYLPRLMTEGVLKEWISKLAHKGKIILSFVDCYTVSRLFFLQQFGANEFNLLMHGEMTKGWDDKKQNFTLPQLAQTLETFGLKVLSKKLDGVQATIIAERP